MILEGIITTLNEDGSVNISPMGPQVDQSMEWMVLRPYQTSTTYGNLKRTGQAVFHVTDDVELLAHSAVGTIEPPAMQPAKGVAGYILSEACRWYALQVNELDDSEPRTRIRCNVVAHGRLRDFFGFNRAKHAVVEAAILATRIGILPDEEIRAEFARLAILVEKTGGAAEHRAYDYLCQYVDQQLSNRSTPPQQP